MVRSRCAHYMERKIMVCKYVICTRIHVCMYVESNASYIRTYIYISSVSSLECWMLWYKSHIRRRRQRNGVLYGPDSSGGIHGRAKGGSPYPAMMIEEDSADTIATGVWTTGYHIAGTRESRPDLRCLRLLYILSFLWYYCWWPEEARKHR